jgi:DNA (cytosine-5)-methyltransferase 1
MTAYYNEWDREKAAVLRELIKAGLIAPGDVDERSITDVRADDLRGFRQCHFFAGVGIWSRALRTAGWPDGRPVWTGSPPCQPFSVAGLELGYDDPRHLAPQWLDLVTECRPERVFGEQVAAAVGKGWLDALQDELEAAGFAIGSLSFPACSLGAPHIRQRLYFGAVRMEHTKHPSGGAVSQHREDGRNRANGGREEAHRVTGTSGEILRVDDTTGARHDRAQLGPEGTARDKARMRLSGEGCGPRGVDDRLGPRLERHAGDGDDSHEPGRDHARQAGPVAKACSSGGMEHGPRDGRDERGAEPGRGRTTSGCGAGGVGHSRRPGPTNGFWADADWLRCRDERWRPVGPGAFPLAHGAAARVVRLRGYGDGIVAPQAEAFIRWFEQAVTECTA